MKKINNLQPFPVTGKSLPGLRLLLQVMALAAILLTPPGCTPAVRPLTELGNVDQSYNALEASRGTSWENTGAGIGLGVHSEAAQTFTVGRSGILTGVAVQIFRGTNSKQDIIFEIRRTVNLIPSEKSSDILARKTIPIKDVPYSVPKFVQVDLEGYCLNVHQGEVLAIILASRDLQSGCGWQTAPGNRYSGGAQFAKYNNAPTWVSQGTGLSGHDLGFTTFVNPDRSCKAE